MVRRKWKEEEGKRGGEDEKGGRGNEGVGGSVHTLGIEVRGRNGAGEEGESGGGRAREGPKGVGHLFPSRTA